MTAQTSFFPSSTPERLAADAVRANVAHTQRGTLHALQADDVLALIGVAITNITHGNAALAWDADSPDVVTVLTRTTTTRIPASTVIDAATQLASSIDS